MRFVTAFRSAAPALATSTHAGVADADAVAADDLSSLLLWIADQPDPPMVELICAAHSGPTRGHRDTVIVRLDGCATGLSAASYLEVMAAGPAALGVRIDGCPAAEHIRATVKAANQLLASCPQATPIACGSVPDGRSRRPVYDLHRLPVSRRRLLGLSRPTTRFTPDVRADERSRILAALRVLIGADPTTPNAVSALRELTSHSANLSANSCTGCGICVRACPSNALVLDRTIDDSGERFLLTFAPADCRDCGRCVTLCPTRCLTRSGAVDWAQVIDGSRRPLAAGQIRRCTRCGDTFPISANATGTRCPVCEFRRASPFGQRLPAPGMAAGSLGRESRGWAR